MGAIRTSTRRRWLWLTVVLVIALIAAACGSDDDGSSSTSTDDKNPAADPNGTVVLAADLTALGGVRLDPLVAPSPNDFVYQSMIYGSLLWQAPDGSFEPGLASEVKVADPQTIDITLRKGLKFSDGTALDGAAVKTSLDRNVAAQVAGKADRQFRVELKEVESITVTGPEVVRIKLKTPIAGVFYGLFGGIEMAIVSPKSIADGTVDTKPIGAGPFVLDSYALNQSLKLKKSPTYYAASEIKANNVQWVQAAGGAPRITALRAGQVDLIPATADDVGPLKGTPDITVDVQASNNSWFWGAWCKSRKPFDDVRVRQAINYAVDRDALNTGALGGLGEPMQGLWSTKSVFFSKPLATAYKHDIKKATDLLTQAGYTSSNPLKFDLMVVAAVPLTIKAGEILQQQLKEAGIQVNLVQTQNIVADFFPDASKAPMVITTVTRTGVDKITRNFQSGSIGNVCGYNNDQLNALVTRLKQVDQNSDEAVKIWADLQKIVADEALVMFGEFTPQVNAYNSSKLAGIEFTPDTFGNLVPNLRSIYVKQK